MNNLLASLLGIDPGELREWSREDVLAQLMLILSDAVKCQRVQACLPYTMSRWRKINVAGDN